MLAERIQVKIYATAAPALDRFIPVFHRWIREKVLSELVIDVADYGHVPNGPGIVLIGHELDYQVDLGDGRFGVSVIRKRAAPAPEQRLGDAVRRALNAARLLESEPGFGDVRFAPGEVSVRLLDRLRAPSDDAHFQTLSAELEALGKKLYGSAAVERVGGSRDPLGARLVANDAAPSLKELLARLG